MSLCVSRRVSPSLLAHNCTDKLSETCPQRKKTLITARHLRSLSLSFSLSLFLSFSPLIRQFEENVSNNYLHERKTETSPTQQRVSPRDFASCKLRWNRTRGTATHANRACLALRGFSHFRHGHDRVDVDHSCQTSARRIQVHPSK